MIVLSTTSTLLQAVEYSVGGWRSKTGAVNAKAARSEWVQRYHSQKKTNEHNFIVGFVENNTDNPQSKP